MQSDVTATATAIATARAAFERLYTELSAELPRIRMELEVGAAALAPLVSPFPSRNGLPPT